MFDVAVIGGGVVGGMIARELTRYSLSVCILEKQADVAMGATSANSGIVHAGYDAKEGTLKAQLNVEGSKMMESLCRELGVKYRRNGSLVIGFNDEDKKTLEMLCARGVSNGVNGVRIINRAELKELEPNISDDAICALHAPTGAIVCPYELNIAAVGNAMDNGVTLVRNFEVIGIDKETDGFSVRSATDTIKARYVVNAAGVHSDDVAALVGDDGFRIHPRRGE